MDEDLLTQSFIFWLHIYFHFKYHSYCTIIFVPALTVPHHVLITLKEVLVTAMLDYGTVFLLIFTKQKPSTHLKQNYTAMIS